MSVVESSARSVVICPSGAKRSKQDPCRRVYSVPFLLPTFYSFSTPIEKMLAPSLSRILRSRIHIEAQEHLSIPQGLSPSGAMGSDITLPYYILLPSLLWGS